MAVDEKALEAAYEQSREVEEYDITEKGLRRILEKYVTARQPTAPVAPGELPTREEIRRELAGIYIGTPYEVLTAQADYVLNLITTQAAFGKYAPVASPEQATAAVAPNNEDDSCQNKSSGPAKRSASRLSSTATHAEDSTTQIPSQTSVGSPSMNAKASTGTELRTCSSTDFMVTDEEWRLLQRQATAAVSPGELDEKAMQAALGAVADFHGDDDIRVARAVSAYLTAAAPVAPGELPTREALARGLFGATYERVGWLHGSESGHEAAFLQADYVLSLITTREAALRQEVERLTASRKRMVADLDGATVRKAMAESALADARQEIERLKKACADGGLFHQFSRAEKAEGERDRAVDAHLATVDRMTAERDQLRQEIAETKSWAELVKVEYDKHAKALESERDQLKRELEEARGALTQASADLSSMRELYSSAAASNNGWCARESEQRTRAETAEARCVELKSKLEEANGVIELLNTDVAGAMADRTRLEGQMKALREAATLSESETYALNCGRRFNAMADALDRIQAALSSQPQPEANTAFAKLLEERDTLKRELEEARKVHQAVWNDREKFNRELSEMTHKVTLLTPRAETAEARCAELEKAESQAMESLTELLADLSTEDAGTHDGSDSDACEICAAVARAYDAIQKPTTLSSQPQPEAQKPEDPC